MWTEQSTYRGMRSKVRKVGVSSGGMEASQSSTWTSSIRCGCCARWCCKPHRWSLMASWYVRSCVEMDGLKQTWREVAMLLGLFVRWWCGRKSPVVCLVQAARSLQLVVVGCSCCCCCCSCCCCCCDCCCCCGCGCCWGETANCLKLMSSPRNREMSPTSPGRAKPAASSFDSKSLNRSSTCSSLLAMVLGSCHTPKGQTVGRRMERRRGRCLHHAKHTRTRCHAQSGGGEGRWQCSVSKTREVWCVQRKQGEMMTMTSGERSWVQKESDAKQQ